jgi:hypothetical protein
MPYKTRQIKIEWLKDTINDFFKSKPKEKIDLKKLVSVFILELNSTERTAKEILKALELSGFIKIEGDYISK